MASYTFQGTADANDCMLDGFATQQDTNYNDFFQMGHYAAGDGPARTCTKFDLDNAAKIPAGSTINSATLTITVKGDFSNNARTASVYRLKVAFVQNQATWNIRSTGNSWQTAGASGANDREATDIGTATQPASPAVDSEISFTLTASAIQEMLSGGSFTNNGFLLQVATENDDQIDYYHTGHASTAKNPKLVVDYTPPAGAATAGWKSLMGVGL